MWKNISDLGKPQITKRWMIVECWVPKATNTQSEYVILIVSPLQPLSQEHISLLRYMHIALLVMCYELIVLVYVVIYNAERKISFDL